MTPEFCHLPSARPDSCNFLKNARSIGAFPKNILDHPVRRLAEFAQKCFSCLVDGRIES
jgi:hypothetical protein